MKVGFNDSRGNYWLGNDLLSQLTLSRRYKLRFDLQSRYNLSWYYAEYISFNVSGESRNYELHVSGYWGKTSVMHSTSRGSSQTLWGPGPRVPIGGTIISSRWKNWGAWTKSEGPRPPRSRPRTATAFSYQNGKMFTTYDRDNDETLCKKIPLVETSLCKT